ncbi:MAG: hypothetical protein LJD31_04765 [Wolbachia endosymbiont of Menacanthus eurysternus]|nr:hypothetical protein [Wolbachia endosymbiont of Menacanthus eurysternus]
MLNVNNEINIKKEERKHSWSTVFAWLYLKTIGRILPKRWNRWAENVLYYNETTVDNEVQTDAFKTVDESAQVDLKPEVAEKESQSEIMSKDGEVQTDRVTFQDMTIQTEYVEKANKNIEVDLKPEIAEKESQSEIMSKDGGVQTDGVAFQDTGMQTECVEKIDKSVEVNLKSEVAEKESQRKLKDENEKLKGELEGANQVLKAFIGLCDDQAQQIANLQTENLSLEVKNRKLLSVIERSITEEAEVKKMDKQVWQNQHKLIDQIKKLEEALKEKDAQYKEQLNENQHALGNLEYKLESLESQSTTAKMQQRKNNSHQINTKSITKSEADLPHEKKASFVKKRKNNLYNEKFVQSYTNSLSEDALEKSIKTKAKPLGSSNVQKLAKNISNKFMSPKNTNSTPHSFMSHTNNTAHVLSLSNVRAGS